MFLFKNYLRVTTILALALGAVAADQCDAAGLVGYRNDTNQAIVIQSTVTVNGVVRTSKPQMLYPGEAAVDGLVATGVRRITISDPKKPNSPALLQGDIICTDDLLLSVRAKAVVVPIKGQPAPAPQLELIKLPTRTMPANPVKPGMPAKPGTGGTTPKKP